ncbi:MAG: PLP-dependent cysteine synthase family protein [Pseudomonadota bacterium]
MANDPGCALNQEPGNTPLIEVDGIHAKLECTNPCGSIKDRIAKFILEKSEKRGLLRPGMKIVEATSGNTGISFSFYAKRLGYPITIVMPENMSAERKQLIRELGAELILVRAGDFAEAARVRDEMANDPTYFNPDQFSNPLNVECHYRTTGREILDQMNEIGKPIDAFVAGIGTGGTLIGVGKALRERFPNIHLAAVEPAESQVMAGKAPGLHTIFGIGDGFVPKIAQGEKNGLHEMIDEVIPVSSEDSKKTAVYIEERFGFCIGMSSGANFVAAQSLRRRFPTVVTIFADGYSKYRSLGLKYAGSGRCRFEDKGRLA